MRNLVTFVQIKKREKNTHEGMLLLLRLSSTPPWAFFMFYKLYKWYQIQTQRIIFIVGDNQLISTLQNFAAPLFKWFSDNQRKANPGKCHLIIN